MVDVKEELVGMLNKALELEYAARIQYLAHAEAVSGLGAEPVIERLKETTSTSRFIKRLLITRMTPEQNQVIICVISRQKIRFFIKTD